MAELRVADIDDDLMAKLKAGAALSRSTIKDYLEKIIADYIRRSEKRNGK